MNNVEWIGGLPFYTVDGEPTTNMGRRKGMIIIEEKRDIFDVPQGYYLAYCITADLSLGAGLAKQMDDNYNMKEKLAKLFAYDTGDVSDFVGESLVIDNVFNLVLKKDIYKKAKYKKLRRCLEDMKTQMQSCCIKKLAIPKLGCGHEGLDWNKVRPIIEDVFCDTDVEILVCTL